jgi:hypothetical protein
MKKPALLLFLIIGTFYLYAQNNCLNFDGTDDYVTLPNGLYSANLQGGTELTIEYWFKGTKLSSAVRFQDGSENYIVAGWLNSGTPYFIISNDGGTGGLPFNVNIQDNHWHHIASVWKSNTTNGFQTYVDGILTNQRNSSNNNLPPIDFNNGGSWLGAINVTAPDEFLNGSLDEVRIWKVARTETEIRQNLYRELPNPAGEANLVAYYKFSETIGTTLADSKGSNTGTLYNMVGNEWETSSAMFGPKNCLDFDGTNDRVISTSKPAVIANSTLTIEAWVRPDVIKESVFAAHGNTYLSIGMTSSGEVVSRTYNAENGGGQINNSGYFLETGSWYHIAAVFLNGESTIYVNGLKVGSTNPCTNSSAPNGREYYVGWGYIVNETYFDGQIDEVRIWSTARTASEIRENMMITLNGDESGLEVYYNFDNTTGDKLPDFSGNENDGTLQGMANDDWVASSAFNTWLGGTSSAWSTASNWTDGVPISTANVGLYDFSGGSDPVIPTGQTLSNLVVGSDVITQVSAGENLTINGNFFNYGNFTVASTGMGISGTGSLIVGGNAAGNITFQRYADVISKGEKWHYVSAPVSGQAINSTWMTDNNIGFTDPAWQFFRFSELYNYWIYFDYEGSQPENFGDETFVDARGYCLTRTSDGVLSFSGTPVTENVSYAATYNEGQGNGINLAGNPFTSAIGVTSNAGTTGNFLAANTALLDDNYEALYIWDEAAGYTFGSQDYKVISNAAISGHTSISQDFIAPGQAFMVKVVSPGGNLQFNKNMQAHNTAAAYKTKETWPSVEIAISGNGSSNTTAIGFHSGMTTGLDPSYDAAKFKGNPNLALYTKLLDDSGKDFAIQALPDQNIEDYVVPVGVDISESGVFEFSATQEKLDNYSLFLEDRQENTFTDLRWETYFTTISESGTGRFYLHFKDATAIGEPLLQTNISFRYQDGKILISNPDEEKGTISLMNVSGQVLARKEINENIHQEFRVQQAVGIYVVRAQTKKSVLSRKIFVK